MKDINTFAAEAVADPTRLDDPAFVACMLDAVELEAVAPDGPDRVSGRVYGMDELDEKRGHYIRSVESFYDAAYPPKSRERLERLLRDGVDAGSFEEVLCRVNILAAQLGLHAV